MNVSVPIPGHSYDIVIERGGLQPGWRLVAHSLGR